MSLQKLKPIIGSFFYAGFLPNAPGTWGSFIALFPIYAIGILAPWYGMAIFALICSLLTLWVARECERTWGGDPSPLIMDEFAGQAMAFVYIPFGPDVGYNILLVVIGFLLFRFFDIRKPLGVNRLQRLPGGPGILMDDLLAGLYAFFSFKILLFLSDYLLFLP